MDVVVAENLRRTYGETVALDGVSLSVSEGEVFGLVGPNGAGKTTLVRALTGTTDAEGTVALFGADPRAVEEERIGLLPQEFDPPDRLTARELISYYRGLYDDGRPVEELLADVGMDDSADTYYENLSGGQKRRTCVAATLVNDPELLILDEPTTGIDPAGRRQLWRLLTDLADAGTTIFITTHYMEEAQQLADRVGLLADGELVESDTPTALIDEYGGDSLLYIDGEFDDSVASLLDYETSLDDDRLTVRDVSPEAIGSITATLEEAGVEYESLTWTEPDLEDVYLELTGQTVTASGQILEEQR
ncbi:ATP-binding cassette domain-containing protein [Halovenus sp. WSH3]|uniref:ATP-binding cassette domain-containing protein n=1 Tax=Halovenus carboxidivorans TaxID=2692199 RepID=A0A6B0TI44_9EURY|nr:ABC transporter ATP-binding protein [Halovenus carboxidivorans]MXR52879.1 ATP-binding cassette domain-containing protein [Halovenus carboxidivorans]